MSIEQMRVLRDRWHQDKKLQAAIVEAFDKIAFDEAYVDACRNALRTGTAPRKIKYIKDNLWGMVEVDWRTMRLLDCPMVQRLRGVKQLGFSYLTYPTAEHSRFVHSLGVGCVVSRFLDAIERHADEQEEGDPFQYVAPDRLRPLNRAEIIHAAILHDVGHMPFSHATEAVLHGLEDLFTCGPHAVSDILGDTQGTLKKGIQLSEMMTLLFILSPRFQDFYNDYVSHDLEDPDALLRVACLIAGLPPDPRLSGVTDIISAASVDADKVDYINRDALACGIPVGVDVSRIFLRSGLIEADREDLRALKDNPEPKEVLFIVNASGMDTLDEIMRARAGLYQRVYLHAVTRSAEAVLSKTLEANATSQSKDAELADAIGLWAISDSALLDHVVKAADPMVQKLGRRLTNRWLPKKACVFSPAVAKTQMPLAKILPRLHPTDEKNATRLIVNTPLEELRHQAVNKGYGSILERRIREEAERLRQLLPEKLRPKVSLDVLVLVGSAYMDKPQTDCIVLQNGDLLRTSDFTNSREQSDAFDIFKAVGYVMCDAEWRVLVLLASRTVLCEVKAFPKPYSFRNLLVRPATGPEAGAKYEDDSVHMVERMILDWHNVVRRAGIKKSLIDQVVGAASAAGYFDANPILAPEVDGDADEIVQIAARLGKFDGQRSWAVTSASVAAFLNQFPPRLRPAMKEMLGKFVFFDSQETVAAILPRVEALGPVQVTALSPNSGQGVRLTLEREVKGREASRDLIFAKDIREALAVDTTVPLVLVDDNISSATQARAQFLAWAGVPRDQWPEECRDEDGILSQPLSADELDKLRARKIRIEVCAGTTEAEAKMRTVLDANGFAYFDGVGFEHAIRGFEWNQELQGFLTEVGLHLMAWSTYRRPPDQLSADEQAYCNQRAFGYGGAGALIASTTNVPTGTVTPIWLPGLVNGRPWMPLMIRQNKLRHLVIG